MGEVTDMFGDRDQTRRQRHAEGMERVATFFLAVLNDPTNPQEMEGLGDAVKEMRSFARDHGMSAEDIRVAYETAQERFIAQYSQVS